MNCERCGEELSIDDPRATKAWCSDRCYQMDKAENKREDNQRGLFEVSE